MSEKKKDDSGTSSVASENEVVSLPEDILVELFPKDFHEDDFVLISKRKKKHSYEDDPNFHDLK